MQIMKQKYAAAKTTEHRPASGETPLREMIPPMVNIAAYGMEIRIGKRHGSASHMPGFSDTANCRSRTAANC